MTGPMYVVVAVLLAGLLYLVLRRRGSRRAEESGDTGFRPVHQVVKETQAPKAQGVQGLPPAPTSRTGDSGSSHPAYPVAPAKYVDRVSKPSTVARTEGPRGTDSAPAVPKVIASAQEPAQGTAAAPWYPEAPAHYDETSGNDEAEATPGTSDGAPRPQSEREPGH